MNNIFKNAYFGKAYKTRDNHKAIYINAINGIKLLTDDSRVLINALDGKSLGMFQEDDIVSEWKEEINEKELEHLSTFYKECHLINGYMDNGIKEAYIAGYRKAKEE